MRPTPARVEVARVLIARVKAADSSINWRDELWYASDSDALDRRDWHVRRFAPADSLRMGNGPVTGWVARLEKPEQAYKAAGLRDNALRVVLEWLRSEWRPEKQRSRRGGSKAGLFWTVFPRGAVQNGEQLARIAARRDFVQRELATRPPSGKKRPGVRREVASKRSAVEPRATSRRVLSPPPPPSSPSPQPPSPSPPPPSLSPQPPPLPSPPPPPPPPSPSLPSPWHHREGPRSRRLPRPPPW